MPLTSCRYGHCAVNITGAVDMVPSINAVIEGKKKMKAIYLNCKDVPFDVDIFDTCRKHYETRNRDTLRGMFKKSMFGRHEALQDVAVIRTGKGRAVVIGYITLHSGVRCSATEWNDSIREKSCVPSGSKYDNPAGKYVYWIHDTRRCEPYPVPSNAVKHGRSWCEW